MFPASAYSLTMAPISFAQGTSLLLKGDTMAQVSLTSELRDPAGRVVAKATVKTPLAAGTQAVLPQEFSLQAPALWDIDTPQLYTLVSTVRRGGAVVDRYETPFGIRDIRFTDIHARSLCGIEIFSPEDHPFENLVFTNCSFTKVPPSEFILDEDTQKRRDAMGEGDCRGSHIENVGGLVFNNTVFDE